MHLTPGRYPLPAPAEVIAPDLLKGAAEAGMDATAFDSNVMSFITGGVRGRFAAPRAHALQVSSEELVRRRMAAKNAAK